MANLYWNMKDYPNASRCYSQAVGMIGSTHKEYATVKLRSEVLEDLVKCSETVKMQDSLQWLSTLPEERLYSIIDKVIEEQKEKDRLEDSGISTTPMPLSVAEKSLQSSGVTVNWRTTGAGQTRPPLPP